MAGDHVLYNYGGMQGVLASLNSCVVTQEALLETGRAHKMSMLGTFTGDSADMFLDCFTRFEGVSNNIIEIGGRGVQAYDNGIMSMQDAEKRQIAAYPT